MRAAPLPPNQSPAPPVSAASNRNSATPSSPATQRGTKGPLPKPPSTQSMRQAYTNQASSQPALSRLSGQGHSSGNGNVNSSNASDSPKNGKGNEIYGTIRNAAPATAVAASAHARDRALHGQDSPGPASPIRANHGTPTAASPPIAGVDFAPGEVGMDDVILDTVIIPAIESVSGLGLAVFPRLSELTTHCE